MYFLTNCLLPARESRHDDHHRHPYYPLVAAPIAHIAASPLAASPLAASPLAASH